VGEVTADEPSGVAVLVAADELVLLPSGAAVLVPTGEIALATDVDALIGLGVLASGPSLPPLLTAGVLSVELSALVIADCSAV
jgi:hypothetical protein